MARVKRGVTSHARHKKALFSYELGVAGSVDCIAEYEDELAIIDFKTSKKPKPRKWIYSHFVQCAAYACMLYEMTGIMVKKFVIIMSCENGSMQASGGRSVDSSTSAQHRPFHIPPLQLHHQRPAGLAVETVGCSAKPMER